MPKPSQRELDDHIDEADDVDDWAWDDYLDERAEDELESARWRARGKFSFMDLMR